MADLLLLETGDYLLLETGDNLELEDGGGPGPGASIPVIMRYMRNMRISIIPFFIVSYLEMLYG